AAVGKRGLAAGAEGGPAGGDRQRVLGGGERVVEADGQLLPRIARLPGALRPHDGLRKRDEGDGIGHCFSWEDDIDHGRLQFATGRGSDVLGATGSSAPTASSGRTGARSALPTGLPHDALLLPVDAHASSRPSWS